MTTPDPLIRMCAFFLPLSLIALFVIRCSSNDAESTSHTQGGSLEPKEATVNSDGGSNSSSTGNHVMVNPTPAEERTYAVKEMRGSRVMLVAELERVRARLNKGIRPHPQRDADQARVGELAQGLERIDRALASLDASTIDTWAWIRESQMDEVAEVRAWMKKNSAYNSTSNT